MKLKSISIENYLGVTQKVTLNLDEGLTTIISESSLGLSSLINGLAIFFGYQWPRLENFPSFGEAPVSPVMTFTAVFSDVAENVSPDRKTYFRPAAEYMLNCRGELEISRSFRMTREGLQERAYVTAIHPSELGLNDLLQVNNTILKRRLTNSTVSASAVDRRCNSSIRHALWEHSTELSLRETEVSLCRGDALLIWEALQMHFPLLSIVRGQAAQQETMSRQAPMPKSQGHPSHENLVRVAPRHYGSNRVQDFSLLEPTELYDIPPSQQWVIIPPQVINKTDPPASLTAQSFLADGSASLPGPNALSHLYCIHEPDNFTDEAVRQTWLERITRLTENPNNLVILAINTPANLTGVPHDSVRVLAKSKAGHLEYIDERPLTGRAGIHQVDVLPRARQQRISG